MNKEEAGDSGGDTLYKAVWVTMYSMQSTIGLLSIYDVHSKHEAGFNMYSGALSVLCKRS